ncbi:hypothetical protein FB451DRAFT_1230559 [Mycena latifolia]|nr:hypothetical protein FB451DRAFT_1230559 [Mycena latifolia]
MAMRSPTKKTKKPPACDACKARRVLCHPQPNGLSCPRCAEKGVICRTTYVPRGRPRKYTRPSDLSLHTSVSVESQTSASSSKNSPAISPYDALVAVRPMIDSAVPLELSCELIKHLYECFVDSPQYRHPLFQNCSLNSALSSVAWKIDLLPPEARVLAYCECALSSSISFHPAIIGSGPQPESFTDRSVFYPGADLRIYGVRRAPMFHALREHAISLACETRIHLEVSECNAASCFILDSLAEPGESRSRPWAVAYISHVRSLAESWSDADRNRAFWSGFLMAEALAATGRRKPILVSHTDQLLMTGSEPPLESMLESLQTAAEAFKKPAAYLAFTVIRPYLFHITRLCREFYDKIAGDYARRHPIAEVSVITFISALSILESIISFLFGKIDFQADPKPLSNELFKVHVLGGRHNGVEENLRSCAFAMFAGYAGLVLALHREMEYRAAADATHHLTVHDSRRYHRTALLRQQAHDIAAGAVEHVVRMIQLLPAPPHIMHLDWSGILGWAQFCLTEADAAGGLSHERVTTFERIINILKAMGYARDIPQSGVLIERMEAYLLAYRAETSLPTDNSGLSDLTFSLNNTWMGMFAVDLGYENLA